MSATSGLSRANNAVETVTEELSRIYGEASVQIGKQLFTKLQSDRSDVELQSEVLAKVLHCIIVCY